MKDNIDIDEGIEAPWLSQKVVDLQALQFPDSGHLMTNKRCHLPRGSTKTQRPGYDEIVIPATSNNQKDIPLIQISAMPSWTHAAFPESIKTLNTI